MTAAPRRISRPGLLAMVPALVLSVLALGLTTPAHAGAATRPLTNLAHIDYLAATVTPPDQAGHTTYQLSTQPEVAVLWTYADARDGGTFQRVGGGAHDPVTDTWGQGAFNADDIARAAVVYLRHWQLTGAARSREQAYQMLRALTFMQTATGPDAGNVVLWMQPDGTLNPSAIPVELPDPSDSGPSYWLARTMWALGEGYAAFTASDPDFAAFLRQRMDLSVTALNRQVLNDYGRWAVSDGQRVPAWLITDGADASAEAVLGLAAFVRAAPRSAPDTTRARTALRQLGEGIAAMSAGDATRWPYGALLPWTHSRSFWHAWGSQLPAALAAASRQLGDARMLRAAVLDTATFTPYLLTATGPINGWLPVPGDLTQISYGVDSRVQSLLAVADTTHSTGLAQLAAMTASWYFGANRAGVGMYDPATGVTYDGLAADGTVNRNSGAESTIHGLLSMLALDAHPDVAAVARGLTSQLVQDGVNVIEGEAAARTTGGAAVVRPSSAWTGESQWSGGAYLQLPAGATASWDVPTATQDRLVQPVINLTEARRTSVTIWRSGRSVLGVNLDRTGAQGVSEAPGSLQPVPLSRALPARATRVDVSSPGFGAPGAQIDALLLIPTVSRLVLAGPGSGMVLLRNAERRSASVAVAVPGDGPLRIHSYDGSGRLVRSTSGSGTSATVTVAPGGFTVVSR